MEKIRFYITCHKPCATVENEVVRPVSQQALAAQLARGDAQDAFVAAHADSFCELVTQYWAWKYDDAEVVGFGHYRRYFDFSGTGRADGYNVVRAGYLTPASAARYALSDEEAVRAAATEAEVIAPQPYECLARSVRSQYARAEHLHAEDLALAEEIIAELHPQYLPAARRYLSGRRMYTCNMFFMRRGLFAKYSAWLFSVLFEFCRRRDMRRYSAEALRTPGHLGERLFGVWLTHYLAHGGKVAHRRILYFEHTPAPAALSPAFPRDNVPVFFATNARFAPFTAAALVSLVRTSSPARNYDVVVLSGDLAQADREKLLSLTAHRKNFSLRFFDPCGAMEGYALREKENISRETYFRLAIPELFPCYDKVLYLDSDLIVRRDVGELFDTELGDNYLAGAPDVCHAGNVNGFDPSLAQYFAKFGYADVMKLINAGVLVMNTAALRRDFSCAYLLDFARQGNFLFQDQDVLNLLCEGRIVFLDVGWNFTADPEGSYRAEARSFAPAEYSRGWMRAASDICICHYAGNEKPWRTPSAQYAEFFWENFRLTPYYEGFLLRPVPEKAGRARRAFDAFVLAVLPKGTRRRAVVKKLYHLLRRRRRTAVPLGDEALAQF